MSLRCDEGFYKVTRADFKSLFGTAEISPPFVLSQDECEKLEFFAEKYGAIKYALYLLGFSDKSEKNLAFKLKSKGYSEDACSEALAVLKKNRYLCDKKSALRRCEILAGSKLYGMRRIISELIAKGYTRDVAQQVTEEARIDFEENLKALFAKLTKSRLPRSREEKKKLFDKLYRYGYNFDEINSVFSLFSDDFGDYDSEDNF